MEMMMEDEMRLNKYLSKAGVASRRKSDEMIEAGRVVVNGEVCTELGTKVDPESAVVEVDGNRVELPVTYVYILLNKPRGYITTLDDPEDRPIVIDLLPEKMPRIWPVGRLDWDSEGLLLLTNDGKLTHLLTHPSFEVEKRYAVKVRGSMKDDSPELRQLQTGVELDDGLTKPAQVALRAHTDKHTWLEFAIHEGRNRQIRRMCEAVGKDVLRLRRLSLGNISIEGVSPGAYRPLLPEEVIELYKCVGERAPEKARPTKRQMQRERERRDHNRKFDVRKVKKKK